MAQPTAALQRLGSVQRGLLAGKISPPASPLRLRFSIQDYRSGRDRYLPSLWKDNQHVFHASRSADFQLPIPLFRRSSRRLLPLWCFGGAGEVSFRQYRYRTVRPLRAILTRSIDRFCGRAVIGLGVWPLPEWPKADKSTTEPSATAGLWRRFRPDVMQSTNPRCPTSYVSSSDLGCESTLATSSAPVSR